MKPLLTTTDDDWFANIVAFQVCARLAEDAGSLSKPRLTQIMRDDTEGKASVLPSLPDFVCDFQIAARAVLSQPQYIMFVAVFVKHTVREESLPQKTLCMIFNLVGAEVIRRGIYSRGYFYQHTSVIRKEAERLARRQRIAVAADRRLPRRKKSPHEAEREAEAA